MSLQSSVRRISSRTAYANPWMSVREDEVVLPDGTASVYGVVVKPDFALILARESGGYWLVEQYRYPIEQRVWEFPQGGWPPGRTGSAEELARAELAEETGLRAARWTHLGHLQEACGYSTQGFDVFLAEQLTPGPTAREQSELDMVHRWFSDEDVADLIRAGDLVDSSSLAALTLANL